MSHDPQLGAVTEFYRTHPISEEQIIGKLTRDGFDPARINEDTLQNYDQDHFGGVAANDALARLGEIDRDCHVLDVCCGLGGPSRYLAHNFKCRVTGVDLTASRVDGARRLTAMVGLDDRVAFERGNALDLPFDGKTFDVVIGQEAFCHVPDKDRLIAECVRVLKPGGRMAFTDILATDKTTRGTKARLKREMTFIELGTEENYRSQLEREGCAAIATEDLSHEWRVILVDRLAMYRNLKDQTVERFGDEHFDKWDKAYSFFVGLYETGKLGGGRFAARRKPG